MLSDFVIKIDNNKDTEMSNKVYGVLFSNRVFKVLIIGELAGIKVELGEYDFLKTGTDPEFLKKNPNGRMPTFECAEGCIFESNAICRYLANKAPEKKLYGEN